MHKTRITKFVTGPVCRLTALLACLIVAALPARADEWHYDNVSRVVAMSDVHGAYDAMVATLQHAEIIDAELRWNGGTTHLVITGDLLDRGPDSRPVMDLVMRLEGEASEAGGNVHQLLGNHEVMNLAGDLRYVAKEEYAAFSDDESADDRERWFQHYRAAAPDTDEAILRAAFSKLAPPGFFAHRAAFRFDGYYGKWLLQKPLMVVINGTAFVHGGVSPFVAEHGLEGINGTLMQELTRYVEQLAELEDASMISPLDNLYDHPAVLQAAIENPDIDAGLRQQIESLIELNSSSIHSAESPLWYRGSVGCSELVEGDNLQAGLQKIGATRVVIGHTPTLTRRVLQRMSGRVIEIDTGMLHAAYKGSGNALIIDGETLTVVNESGATNSPPVQHPRRVGLRAEALDADKLAQILTSGTVVESTTDDAGQVFVKLSLDEHVVFATFAKRPRKKGYVPELAAYKLDLILGLEMVPVTVMREIDGTAGTLQFLPRATKSEQDRVGSGQGGSAWCDLDKQWGAMYIFDSLIFNPGRVPAHMLYSPDNWQLVLINHNDSFRNSSNRPPYLQSVQLNVTDHWLRALQDLDDAVLQDKLGDVLPKRQLKALGKRRDGLISDAAEQ